MGCCVGAEGAYLVGDTAVFSTTFHVIREYTSLTRNLEARAAQSVGQMARYKDKRKLVSQGPSHGHLQVCGGGLL